MIWRISLSESITLYSLLKNKNRLKRGKTEKGSKTNANVNNYVCLTGVLSFKNRQSAFRACSSVLKADFLALGQYFSCRKRLDRRGNGGFDCKKSVFKRKIPMYMNENHASLL